MELITRQVIADLEGVSEVTDDMVTDYLDENHEKYHNMVREIGKRMKFTSLKFNKSEDLIEAIGLEPCKLCTYCFNGKE